jgi:hypothetical protein
MHAPKYWHLLLWDDDDDEAYQFSTKTVCSGFS